LRLAEMFVSPSEWRPSTGFVFWFICTLSYVIGSAKGESRDFRVIFAAYGQPDSSRVGLDSLRRDTE
jgi:hypothetical protein